MKKLELKFGGVKEMLTKEQMKKISGGTDFGCFAIGTGQTYEVSADNCEQAQAECDAVAWSNSYGDDFPNGCECPCL
jgi:hypothetical protein